MNSLNERYDIERCIGINRIVKNVNTAKDEEREMEIFFEDPETLERCIFIVNRKGVEQLHTYGERKRKLVLLCLIGDPEFFEVDR